MKEEWRPIEGFPYQVSSLGRIMRTNPASGTFVGKILSPGNRKRRQFVIFYKKIGKSFKPISLLVHRIVANAFIGPCPEGKQINHKDGNPQNNRADNLEYVTPKENMIHAELHGLLRHPKGEHNHSKLKTNQVLMAISHFKDGYRISDIARKFKVSHTTISRIVHKKKWRHMP